LGYSPDARNLKYLSSRFFTADKLKEVIPLAIEEGYNEFNSSTTVDQIIKLFSNSKFKVAREGSVCIYVYPKRGKHIKFNPNVYFNSLLADEMCFEPDGALRLWWD
jgi:hypothetical protein